ncbi:MAG: DUF4167 domain-containing protein [Variibacter sp.]
MLNVGRGNRRYSEVNETRAMRNGQNKRMRGRNNRKGQNPLTRVYESNGPDVKIRGTASHVAEKYMQLARDSQSSGDPVSAENYYQHAEHYFRLIAAMQEQLRQTNPHYRENEQRDSFDDSDDEGQDYQGAAEAPYAPRDLQQQPYPPREQSYGPREPRFGGRDQQSQHYRYRERDNRERDSRDRDNREGYRPQFQPQAQPQPQIQPPRANGEEAATDIGLPAFVTGGQPPATASNGAAAQQDGGFQQNGFEGQPDRFPLHRRRRRPRGPRADAPQQPGGPEAGE